MSLLVRLYPAAWRERYGDELAAVLEDRPAGPFDVADVLLGALDAHLHLRGLGHLSQHRRGIPMSLGLAGLAAAIGGGMWGLLFVLVGASHANAVDLGFAWTPVVWIPIVLIAGLTLLAALGGLSARQFQAHRRSIWVASLLPVAGIGIMFFGLLTLIPSGGAADEGSIQALVLSGGIVLMLIGSLVFAAVTFAIGALSRVAAGAIVVGVVPTILGLFGPLGAVWLAVGGLIFGLGWIGLGIDAVRRDRRPVSAEPAAA